MKHKKITALLFAVILGFTVLTACTRQSVGEEVTPTTAELSESQSKAEKDCCQEKAEENSKPDCCKNKSGESSDIPDCCEGE